MDLDKRLVTPTTFKSFKTILREGFGELKASQVGYYVSKVHDCDLHIHPIQDRVDGLLVWG